ncbi:NADH-quinone oxidoreductase subunit C [Candidatus Parabeggiatoa sp. HSG14]|uniref:NADH-quinone oxidoreductase subunit C n=1 Tax=Candidatus Parabeggiatoa sp. HSG14 TaxID=3055593 RepID=UPI0025A6E071|nr:NADH-quinone oxidoreductase subunit C [Thiotrichales bacterium HSG14]
MANSLETLRAELQDRFADISIKADIAYNELTLEVPTAHVFNVCQALRNRFDFSQLMDLCGVDYSQYGQADWETKQASSTGFSRGVSKGIYKEEVETQRFAVVYHLLSIKRNQRIRVRAFTEGEPPLIDSVISIWSGADWFEREAFDLFGIVFEGHPDLRRIFTDYGFIGHPFRKDFPLTGNVEMRYDPEKQRVIYEPVSIDPRTLVPKVIRHDNRYAN